RVSARLGDYYLFAVELDLDVHDEAASHKKPRHGASRRGFGGIDTHVLSQMSYASPARHRTPKLLAFPGLRIRTNKFRNYTPPTRSPHRCDCGSAVRDVLRVGSLYGERRGPHPFDVPMGDSKKPSASPGLLLFRRGPFSRSQIVI